jgi:DNA helicase II / ATP-dependent DNA helicase PcrA
MTPPTITPSNEQQAILDLGLTSIKVRAGAGTGKTTTVALVIANLVERHGLDPEQVVGITFTNKAASELADRVRSMIGSTDPVRQAEIHTYHGFAAQILGEFGPLAGLDGRFQIITPTFERQLLREAIIRSDPRHIDITWRGWTDRIAALGDRLGDHLLTPDDILSYDDDTPIALQRRDMATILKTYEEEKRRLGVVDFSDLVTLAARLMTDHPDLAGLVRRRYRVVVLDEYQDTNPAQRILLQAIFGSSFPVIAVGDEDQTIYEWRGASAENFGRFESHFPTPDGQPAHLCSLTLNRRSSQTILDLANKVRLRANPGAEALVSALPPERESRIRTHWADDALAEADWIAARYEELADNGLPWRDMAVLLRKNKDFALVVDAFSRRDIPVEVANVGGLLAVPEVADLVAWLRILDDPEDSASVLTVLTGSRYGLGMADVARLVSLATGSREEDTAGEPVPLTLIESAERVAEIVEMRPEARAAVSDFNATYRQALLEAQGISLVEICRLVLDLTGAWRDIEALPRNQRLTARLNLYRLLDLAEDWSPLRGRPSLPAFLDYLATTEEEASDEVDSARLSGEDAVTLVTIHRAKGLEWDTVALPAVYAQNFPARSGGFDNPLDKPYSVPADLRLDTTLAAFGDDLKMMTDHLRDAHNAQEWRTAYVAVTRAKRRLLVTGAHWYGHPTVNMSPVRPSPLWELANEHTGDVDRIGDPPPAPERLRVEWVPAPDPHFDEGWDGALRAALTDPGWVDRTAERLGVAPQVEKLAAEIEGRLFDLAQVPDAPVAPEPPSVSVTGLVTYAQCPKRFFWSEVDPLPRRLNPAASRGTEVHRRIELHQRGVAPLHTNVAAGGYDTVFDEAAAPGAYETYLQSRFASRPATLVEQPFKLVIGDSRQIRGRIDAIYAENGTWEVVDFKSGRPDSDPSRTVQLQAYAVAVDRIDFGLEKPIDLTVTFAYLGGGGSETSYQADRDWIDSASGKLDELMDAIADERFDESPGPWCGSCDFVRFCRPGQQFLAG